MDDRTDSRQNGGKRHRALSRREFIGSSLAFAGWAILSGGGLFPAASGCRRAPGQTNFPERARSLVDQMTLEEKISQLGYDAPAIPRLDIPTYNWWNECLHGVARAGKATVFPQAIGMAASWNPDLMREAGNAIADEARAKHEAFVEAGRRDLYMGLTFFTPNINIIRDPRWGRGQETYGEDPFLAGRMAAAFIRGLQGDDPDYYKTIATAKHFAVHSGPESLRHEFNAEVSERDLWETYLPAFETTVKEAGVASVMCAYNSFRGMPCCGNNPLLDSILREQLDFGGYVVSDCWAISDFYNEAFHNITDSAEQAAAMALNAGTDLNCGVSFARLAGALEQGLVNEETIDTALGRLFEARLRLGLLGNPGESPYAGTSYAVVGSRKHRERALQVARESIVLLKNEPAGTDRKPLLPLSKKLDRIAVIGPNADDYWTMLGNYHGTPEEAVTPLEGIRHAAGAGTEVRYAQGNEIAEGVPRLQPVEAQYLVPARGEGKGNGLSGEYYPNENFEGKPAFTRIDGPVDFTWLDDTPVTGEMADAFSVRWTGQVKPPVSVIYVIGFTGMNGYRLYFEGEQKFEQDLDHEPRRSSFEVELEAGNTYDITIDYFNTGPDPRAHLEWYVPGADLLREAREAASASDAVILCLGLNSRLEGEQLALDVEGFSGGDRTSLRLPAAQRTLLDEMLKVNVPLVLVLVSGSAIALEETGPVPSIVQAWYGGQSGGTAMAEVLFGEYNPSGRLPATFYKSVNDLPDFTDYSMDNRTYRYFRGEPQFPFGHGLSYSDFEYDNLRFQPGQNVFKTGAGAPLTVNVDITNTSGRDGEEVVQLYLQFVEGRDPWLIKELKAFQKIWVESGRTKTVSFRLNEKAFLQWDDRAGERIVHRGPVRVLVGRSSADIKLEDVLSVE